MDSYFLHTGKYLVELSDIEGLKNLYSELSYEYNQKKHDFNKTKGLGLCIS